MSEQAPGQQPQVLVARTAVMVPLRWADSRQEPRAVADALLQRKVPVGVGQEPLWADTTLDSMRTLLEELTPAMQRALGLGGGEGPTTTVALQLGSGGTNLVFNAVALAAGRAVERRYFQPRVDQVHLFLLGAGVGLCVLHLDWVKGRKAPLFIDELVAGLDVARTAQLQEDKRPGWLLAAPRDPKHAKWSAIDQVAPERRAALGDVLCAAKHCGEPVPLNTLVDLLLLLPGEDPQAPPSRACVSRYTTLHSVVVLDRPPPDPELADLLFRLRRGYGDTYVPPRHLPPDLDARSARDVVLAPRGNRLVSVAREGGVALSWPVEGCSEGFELSGWPDRFMQVYLMLALQVQTERLTLERLADRVACQVQAVSHTQDHLASAPREAARQLAAARNRLRDDARAVVQYTLSLSTEDAGGPTEYADFHEAHQEVWRIPRQRAELRAEVAEVLAVVESGYGQVSELLARADAQVRDRIDQRTRRFEQWVGGVGVIALPITVLGGWYGMNMYGASVTPPGRAWVVALVLVGIVVAGALLYRVFQDDD